MSERQLIPLTKKQQVQERITSLVRDNKIGSLGSMV